MAVDAGPGKVYIPVCVWVNVLGKVLLREEDIPLCGLSSKLQAHLCPQRGMPQLTTDTTSLNEYAVRGWWTRGALI